ncbi:MAG: BON domain-containing protein [Alphaproteobacteria bacterium]|nr:BON domain-containing protein [Alphaproteobacteria bacterium]
MAARAGSAIACAGAIAAALAVGACSPAGMAVGAASTAGVAAVQERGFLRTLDDAAVKARIGEAYLNASETILLQVTVRVHEGRVLLVGALPDAALRVRAVELARAQPGVRAVIDELQDGDDGIGGYARDSWITAQVNTKLTFNVGILSVNYQVDTVGGVVYLFGIAQDRAEHDRAVADARAVRDVRRVVSHVMLKSDPSRRSASGDDG